MSSTAPNSTADYINVTSEWTTKRASTSINQPWPGMTTPLVLFTVFIALVNLGLPAVILANPTLRWKRFYWHILSLCLWDVLIGLFFVPLNLRHQVVKKWEHGEHVCRWVIVMDFAHIAMAAGILTCVCLERIMTIIHAYKPIAPRAITACNVFLLSFSWVFLFCVCIPVTLLAEDKEHDKPEMTCWLVPYDYSYHVIVYVLFVFPIIILSIFSSVLLIAYACLTGRTTSGNASTEAEVNVEDLRMTTIASWSVSAVAICMMLPLTILDSYSAMFHMGTRYDIYASTYMTYLARGAVIPYFWLIVPELRGVVKNLLLVGIQKLGILKRGSSTQFLYQRDME